MLDSSIPVALVLGSGGARGLAHIGVIRALREDSAYRIHSITGSSMGALVGGLYAAGKLDAYTDWVCGLSRTDVWALMDFSFTRRGLIEGERLMNKLADLVGDARIEELPLPFTAVASDIRRRREVWLNEGSLFEAIRASIAVPGLFTPLERRGVTLVDGGLLSPLPIAPSLRHGAERIVAVSLNGPSLPRSRNGSGPGSATAEPPRTALQRWIERTRDSLGLARGSDEPSDDAFDIISRSLEAMQDRIARYQIAAYRPDILVEIPANACGLLDFHCAERMIAMGHAQARAALERSRDVIPGAGF
jgi:NTE family protein